MIRVLIVANEHEAGLGIAGRIAADPVIEVAGITHSLEDALDFASACSVDLLFVRAHLWLGAEKRTHAKYRSRTTALPVVVFCQTESGSGLTSVLQTGASCLCPLNVDDALLCEIIKRYAAVSSSLSTLLGIRAGIPDIIQRQFALGPWPQMPAPTIEHVLFELTESERQILRMAGAGMSNASWVWPVRGSAYVSRSCDLNTPRTGTSSTLPSCATSAGIAPLTTGAVAGAGALGIDGV